MKFGTLMQFHILDRSDRYKFKILKIQHGDVRHLKKSKNHHISAAVGAISTRFGMVMQSDPLDRTLKFSNL